MNLGRLPVIVGLMGLPQGSWQRESVATSICGDGIHDVRFSATTGPSSRDVAGGAEADAVNRVATGDGSSPRP